TQQAIRSLKEEEATAMRSLEQTSQGLEALRVERDNITRGRVNIVSSGDLPVSPSSDRRIALAVIGAGMGASAGLGLIGAYGLLNRRYRYVDEFSRGPVQLLGSLPNLNSADAEENEIAALSVHHLRNLLLIQDGPKAGRGRVIAITSAAAGDGKTSL